jgi:hypothetical protein
MSTDIDTTPTQEIADNAAKGLEYHNQFNRGGTEVGLSQARDLKNQKEQSEEKIKKMSAYFARHEVDKNAENFGNDNDPSAGYIAWLLWGGDAGREWAEDIKLQMNE